MTDQLTTPEATGQVAVGEGRDTVLAEAVGIIDGALAKMMQRELVSSGEVADLLLDMRTLLTSTK